MSHLLKRGSHLGLAVLALVASATGARADLILSFSQLGTANTVVATNSPTSGDTLIQATDVSVLVTAIDSSSGLSVPFLAYLQLMAASIGTAEQVATSVRQSFAGTFAITSGLGGTGTNYLSGSFVDSVFGSGTGLVMTVSNATPGEFVDYSSDLITSLSSPRAMSLAMTNVAPILSIVNGTLAPFTAGISGNFSASPEIPHMPEPASVVTACGGLMLLGGSAWLRRRRGC